MAAWSSLGAPLRVMAGSFGRLASRLAAGFGVLQYGFGFLKTPVRHLEGSGPSGVHVFGRRASPVPWKDLRRLQGWSCCPRVPHRGE